ncbi:hypothetical protein C8J57DRAFT_1605267 [Mycena rebaudengoi]|nr:hypothetical protein C8J57DRAFT_1605267 [Mycena rebaudengoi]
MDGGALSNIRRARHRRTCDVTPLHELYAPPPQSQSASSGTSTLVTPQQLFCGADLGLDDDNYDSDGHDERGLHGRPQMLPTAPERAPPPRRRTRRSMGGRARAWRGAGSPSRRYESLYCGRAWDVASTCVVPLEARYFTGEVALGSARRVGALWRAWGVAFGIFPQGTGPTWTHRPGASCTRPLTICARAPYSVGRFDRRFATTADAALRPPSCSPPPVASEGSFPVLHGQIASPSLSFHFYDASQHTLHSCRAAEAFFVFPFYSRGRDISLLPSLTLYVQSLLYLYRLHHNMHTLCLCSGTRACGELAALGPAALLAAYGALALLPWRLALLEQVAAYALIVPRCSSLPAGARGVWVLLAAYGALALLSPWPLALQKQAAACAPMMRPR